METTNQMTTHEVQLPSLKNWGDNEWRERAQCRNTDTNLFFPTHESLDYLTPAEKKNRKYKADRTNPTLPGNLISQARIMCVQCQVRTECLTFAVENRLLHGMYGGKTPKERRGMEVGNVDIGIPISTVIKDLRRVRRLNGITGGFRFADDLAKVINRSVYTTKEILRNNDFDKIV